MSNPISVIIPSKTASNLVASVAAVRKHQPDARIIVVDDGIGWRGLCSEDVILCEVIKGAKPFVFSRNVNIGIRAAGDSDVVLLNDDAILETPNGFGILQQACIDDPSIGAIAAVTDMTGQPQQHYKGVGVRIVDHFAFVCVFIPHRTREIIAEITETGDRLDAFHHCLTGGLLDDRFDQGYGSEDRDYCEQVKAVGLKCAVHDHCFVNHSSLRSSFRGDPTAAGDIWANNRILCEKWRRKFV